MQLKYSTTALPAFLFVVFLAIPCLSQDSQATATNLTPPISPRFEHLTIADGLSQGMVNATYQDRILNTDY